MIGRTTTTGHPADLIDDLLNITKGEVLAPPTGNESTYAGEYDQYRVMLDRTDMRKLVAAGLLSAERGMPPDRLAHWAGYEGTADEFLAWYLDRALTGLALRADRRAGRAWEDRQRPVDEFEAWDAEMSASEAVAPALPPLTGDSADGLPALIAAYLDRLVYAPKRHYACQFVAHTFHHAECPADPGKVWAADVRVKVARLARKVGQ